MPSGRRLPAPTTQTARMRVYPRKAARLSQPAGPVCGERDGLGMAHSQPAHVGAQVLCSGASHTPRGGSSSRLLAPGRLVCVPRAAPLARGS